MRKLVSERGVGNKSLCRFLVELRGKVGKDCCHRPSEVLQIGIFPFRNIPMERLEIPTVSKRLQSNNGEYCLKVIYCAYNAR